MSNQELLQIISAYVQSAQLGVLAYVRADGTPVQRTFGAFAVSGNDIVFITRKSTAKVSEIASHSKVSFFVEKQDQMPSTWKSVLYFGSAAPIADEGDLRLAVEAICERSAFIKDMVLKVGIGEFLVYRLKTSAIDLLDNSKGQGHTDTIVV
jgi:nitroimidazol reductase NimA-like FMN-containing flavoprotein (pyridoxamine 5'-phosphate oxidase superfamily)